MNANFMSESPEAMCVTKGEMEGDGNREGERGFISDYRAFIQRTPVLTRSSETSAQKWRKHFSLRHYCIAGHWGIENPKMAEPSGFSARKSNVREIIRSPSSSFPLSFCFFSGAINAISTIGCTLRRDSFWFFCSERDYVLVFKLIITRCIQ